MTRPPHLLALMAAGVAGGVVAIAVRAATPESLVGGMGLECASGSDLDDIRDRLLKIELGQAELSKRSVAVSGGRQDFHLGSEPVLAGIEANFVEDPAREGMPADHDREVALRELQDHRYGWADEDRDAIWAPAFEGELRSLFHSGNGGVLPSRMTLAELECRTSRCRVNVRFDGEGTLLSAYQSAIPLWLGDLPCGYSGDPRSQASWLEPARLQGDVQVFIDCSERRTGRP